MNRTPAGEDYTRYMKPLTGKLLQFLKLDTDYIDGRGNRLVYRDGRGKQQSILDATGGYGANLLGHKHPEIYGAIPEMLTMLPPNHLQGATAGRSAILARELSDRLSLETGHGPWVCTLANSGAEAVEAALKHALLHHKEWTKKKAYWLNTWMNSLRKELEGLSTDEKGRRFTQLRAGVRLSHLPRPLVEALHRAKNLEEAIDCLDQQNQKTLGDRPYFLAVEGGFHGKTLGALSVTSNSLFREDFFVDDRSNRSLFIRRNDLEDVTRACDEAKAFLYLPVMRTDNFSLISKEVNKIAACIVEPIQGEGGIHLLEKVFLQGLRKQADRRGFLLIFDEIQAGLYRTGTLSSGTHSGVCADLYCFAKGLGGGIAKISAAMTRKNKSIDRFGLLHTSTFAEDSFSSAVACKVLELLTDSSVTEAMVVARVLKSSLERLQQRYPTVIREVRGQGFLLGVEFHSKIRHSCYEFKFFFDNGLLGYLFSSALLEHEHLRVNPTLSSPLTLRLEPSLFTTVEDSVHICKGLEGLCKAITDLDMKYFFGHLFPGCEIGQAHRIPQGVIHYGRVSGAAAVFLSHVIRTGDVKKIFHALKNVPDGQIEQILTDIFELVDFEVYFSGALAGDNGHKVGTVVLALPIPSPVIHATYKSERSYLLTDKIQRALQYARVLGAGTVGLGQFTSIVTHNGLSLDPQGMNLTTGNAYTVALAIEAGLQAANERRIQLEKAHIGFLGAAGNIVSVAASILADYCRKISLFYHTRVDQSVKLAATVRNILRDIAASGAEGYCTRKLRQLLAPGLPTEKQDLLAFLDRTEVRKVLTVETDLRRLRQCEILLTGTNVGKAFIEPAFVRQNALIIDVGIPGDVPVELTRVRPDVTVIKGGIALMPQPDEQVQSICLPAFPLKEGQAFACMSETFSIGLANGRRVYHVGPLSKRVVQEARSIAAGAGFRLSHYKDISTFDF